MRSESPAFLIREARIDDHLKILKLARELDSINLPTDAAELRDALARSALSFRNRIKDRSRTCYIFCAEQISTGRIAGASMIIGKHGTPQSPHYYLEVDSEERYSHTLRRMFRHTYLRLRYSMDGPTEVAGLIVTAPLRLHPEKIGKQLSWVRFLYIAKHPARFESRVLSEMLPQGGPDYRNEFWDHYGREVTGLTFREADRLSTHDKEFIRTLFPDAPLYTFLLPQQVRESLGRPGDATRGAIRLLEQAGMKFLGHIDPFDAGPYYGALVQDLVPVKQYRPLKAEPGDPQGADTRSYLVARETSRTFCCVRADAIASDDRIVIAREAMEALKARSGEMLDVLPLP